MSIPYMRTKTESPKKLVNAKASKPAVKVSRAETKVPSKVPHAKAKVPCQVPLSPANRRKAISRPTLFVAEYLIDMNGRRAAIRAGYSPASARQTAANMLATPSVQLSLINAMADRAKRLGMDADKVLQRYWDIACADAGELAELRRGCCRYCWSGNNRYQFTARELEDARAEFEERQADGLGQCKTFDDRGGIGFNPTLDPSPACPECFGDGEERVFAKDTRDLSPQARLLFAGVKTTQHGIEIKTHDQLTALAQVGKHLGMFKEKVEVSSAGGADLIAGVVVVPAKALAAAFLGAVVTSEEHEQAAAVSALRPQVPIRTVKIKANR